jgi:aryl-alcohol dehydrogenase-like predicted oxidoreductase
VLATKVFALTVLGPNDKGLARKHLMSAINASLQRLSGYLQSLYGCADDFAVTYRVTEIPTSAAPNAQIALAYMRSKPVITSPIVSVSKPGHLEDAAPAVDVELSEDEIKRLEEPC